jgi:hypothetical protein
MTANLARLARQPTVSDSIIDAILGFAFLWIPFSPKRDMHQFIEMPHLSGRSLAPFFYALSLTLRIYPVRVLHFLLVTQLRIQLGAGFAFV